MSKWLGIVGLLHRSPRCSCMVRCRYVLSLYLVFSVSDSCTWVGAPLCSYLMLFVNKKNTPSTSEFKLCISYSKILIFLKIVMYWMIFFIILVFELYFDDIVLALLVNSWMHWYCICGCLTTNKLNCSIFLQVRVLGLLCCQNFGKNT